MNEKKKIFFNAADRNDFLDRLAVSVAEGALDVYAWVLMPNHFHLLCKARNRSLSSSMRKILTGYVVNFNRHHRRYGHLFQNRYKSIVCHVSSHPVKSLMFAIFFENCECYAGTSAYPG